jgi:hypothetical protein
MLLCVTSKLKILIYYNKLRFLNFLYLNYIFRDRLILLHFSIAIAQILYKYSAFRSFIANYCIKVHKNKGKNAYRELFHIRSLDLQKH